MSLYANHANFCLSGPPLTLISPDNRSSTVLFLNFYFLIEDLFMYNSIQLALVNSILDLSNVTHSPSLTS